MKLENAEKNATKWQEKFNDLLYENCEMKNKVKSVLKFH